MAYNFQVVLDSTDPHTLADWWAETLGWPVEPSDEAMIRDLVARGHAQESDTKTHNGVLVWAIGAGIRHPDPLPSGQPQRVLFQAVPEKKSVKNRMHVDVWVGAEQREAERDRLVARGATYHASHSQGPFSWFVMTDPEGNEFCLS
ncbi:VOC family protein [Actinoplanes sp. NPDC049265]|uniref:VOC family protein n=1 Tax=Actinoplanes sp. NPDC049265 TaxID=3363902 RepID=UPI0037106AA1